MGVQKKLRFVIVGSGYRALFYVRIARALPERFSLLAMVCRTPEKAERIAREQGIFTTCDEARAAAMNPDFAVVAVSKASICDVTLHWARMGIPVLCETPAALEFDGLVKLWEAAEAGAKIQVAEQYALRAPHSARIHALGMGYLGDPYSVSLSVAHDYHGVSLMRRYLGLGIGPMEVCARKYFFPVMETDSRSGPVTDGRVEQADRVRADFSFEGGKAGFYDFCKVQYHTFIRASRVAVQGVKGELDGDVLRYMECENGQFLPRSEAFIPVFGTGGADGGNPDEILLGGQVMYRNPFPGSGLNEDETAIARMLTGMEAYLDGGDEVYPLAEALEDAYGLILMKRAMEQPGCAVKAGRRPWA